MTTKQMWKWVSVAGLSGVFVLGWAGFVRGTVVLNDTCDQDVRTNWADPWNGAHIGEGVQAVTWDTGEYVIGNGVGELHTIADFPDAVNGYTLSYTDLKYQQGYGQFWTVYGPGGCALATQGVGNAAQVIYNGTTYPLDAPASGLNPSAGGENSAFIMYERISSIQHRLYIILEAGSWRDTSGGWHIASSPNNMVILFDHTFDTAPDFATYGSKITMTNAQWQWGPYSTQIDNIILDVTPPPPPVAVTGTVAIPGVCRRQQHGGRAIRIPAGRRGRLLHAGGHAGPRWELPPGQYHAGHLQHHDQGIRVTERAVG